MTDKLLELAQKWGVETHVTLQLGAWKPERPRLDIAHDLEKKLPARKGRGYEWGLYSVDAGWCWYWDAKGKEREGAVTDFESTVIELSERAGEQK